MFIGHYGVGYIVRKKASDIPLWLLFASVQLLDIIAFTLVLLGIEKASYVPRLFLKKKLYSYLLLFLMVGAFTGMVFAVEPPIFIEHYALRTSIVLFVNFLFIFIAYLWDQKIISNRIDSGYRDSRHVYKR